MTEFLPISSSGHLVIAQHLFGLGGAENLTFDILLHVATLFAVVVYMRRDLAALVAGVLRDRKQTRIALYLLLAMVPTGIIGLGIRKGIESAFETPAFVGAMLLVTGTMLFVAPRLSRARLGLEGIRGRQALSIGVGQGIAALPGISRSGTTICAAMLVGVQAEAAARFSFLLSIPAILAATALDMRNITNIASAELPPVLVGMGAAFVVGLASIAVLMRLARRGKFDPFAYYCWALGGLTLVATYWRG